MTVQFGRKIAISVSDGQSTRTWTDLKMDFSAAHTDDSEPSQAQVAIYNLNSTSIAFIKESGQTLRIESSYNDNSYSLVFQGDIEHAWTSISGPDVAMNIKAEDGGNMLSTTRVSVSLAPGATAYQALSQLIAAAGAPLGVLDENMVSAASARVYATGITMFGSFGEFMDNISHELGGRWFVTDGAFNFIEDNAPVDNRAVLVTPNTGLIGSPEVIMNKSRNDSKKISGIKWQMLMQPSLRPRQSFVIASREHDRDIVIAEKVMHKGDNWNGEFFTIVEATLPVAQLTSFLRITELAEEAGVL